MSRGYDAPPISGTVVFTSVDGIVSWAVAASGVSEHDALGAASLVWTASAHTGTASRIAAFNGAGAASYLIVGSDVQAYDAELAAIAALAVTDGNFVVGNGATWVAESGATARTSLGLGSLATASSVSNADWSGTDLAVINGGTGSSTAAAARTALGLAIGTDVQAYDAELAAIAALAVTDGNFVVGNGATWVAESGATARTSLGLGTIATQNSNAVAITGGTISGVSGTGITSWVVDSLTINGAAITSTTSITLTAGGTGDVAITAVDDVILTGDDVQVASGTSLTVNDTTPEKIFSATDSQASATMAMLRNTNSGAGADVLFLDLSAVANAGTGNLWAVFDDAGGAQGSISGTGGGAGCAFNTSSDARLKSGQRPTAMDGLAIIRAIQVRDFEWTYREHRPDTGLIAQELIEVYPAAVAVPDPLKAAGRRVVSGHVRGRLDPVTGVRDVGEAKRIVCDISEVPVVLERFSDGAEVAIPGPGERGFVPWGIDYARLVIPLIRAVQEQASIIDAMKKRIDALERRGS